MNKAKNIAVFSKICFFRVGFYCCIFVLSGHSVSRFFGAYNPETNTGITEQLFRVIFAGYGSPAVMIFFVMSGLFIENWGSR